MVDRLDLRAPPVLVPAPAADALLEPVPGGLLKVFLRFPPPSSAFRRFRRRFRRSNARRSNACPWPYGLCRGGRRGGGIRPTLFPPLLRVI